MFYIPLNTYLNHGLTIFGIRHSTQGLLDGAAKSTLENEFGTSVDDDIVKKILEEGTLQEVQVCYPFSFFFFFEFLYSYFRRVILGSYGLPPRLFVQRSGLKWLATATPPG